MLFEHLSDVGFYAGGYWGKIFVTKIALVWDSLSFQRDILTEIFSRLLADRNSVKHKAGRTDEEASTQWNGQAL